MAPALFPIQKPEQRATIAVCIALSILPAMLVALRILARRIAHRVLDKSDWLMAAACLFTVGHWVAIMVACLVGGMGYLDNTKLTAEFGPEPLMMQYKIEFADIIVVVGAMALYKLSVLALYVRILPFRAVAIISRIIALVTVFWWLAACLSNVLLVRPIAANWDPSVQVTWEGSAPAVSRFIDIMTIVTDLTIIALPFKYLAILRLPFWKKFALIFTFSLGVLTVVTAFIRLYLGRWDSNEQQDLSEPFIWAGIEPSIGIVAGCIPTLRPLLGRSTYTATGTAQARTPYHSPRPPMSFDTRVLDDIDKDDTSLVQLRPMGPDNYIMIGSNVRDSGMGRSRASDDIDSAPPPDVAIPDAIHVRTEWKVSGAGEPPV